MLRDVQTKLPAGPQRVNPVPRPYSRGIGALPSGDDVHSSPPSPRTTPVKPWYGVHRWGFLWYGVKGRGDTYRTSYTPFALKDAPCEMVITFLPGKLSQHPATAPSRPPASRNPTHTEHRRHSQAPTTDTMSQYRPGAYFRVRPTLSPPE